MSVPRTPFADFLRRLLAAGSAALVLALTVFAASPELHDWLHKGTDTGTDDACAVVLFSGGVPVVFDVPAVVPPAAEWTEAVRPAVAEIFVVSPRYLHQPERGPPAV